MRDCNGGHNQFLHDGMCDEYFFETYFPEDVDIYETNVQKFLLLLYYIIYTFYFLLIPSNAKTWCILAVFLLRTR